VRASLSSKAADQADVGSFEKLYVTQATDYEVDFAGKQILLAPLIDDPSFKALGGEKTSIDGHEGRRKRRSRSRHAKSKGNSQLSLLSRGQVKDA
jgi:hypothetical protein